jgi:hypothetical protein
MGTWKYGAPSAAALSVEAGSSSVVGTRIAAAGTSPTRHRAVDRRETALPYSRGGMNETLLHLLMMPAVPDLPTLDDSDSGRRGT